MTATVFLPMAGAIIIVMFMRGDRSIRFVAGAIALADFVLTIVVFSLYDSGQAADSVQLVDKIENWIPVDAFNVQYFLGVDGLSAPLVLLTGLLGMVAVFGSWGVKLRVREYFMWLLVHNRPIGPVQEANQSIIQSAFDYDILV